MLRTVVIITNHHPSLPNHILCNNPQHGPSCYCRESSVHETGGKPTCRGFCWSLQWEFVTWPVSHLTVSQCDPEQTWIEREGTPEQGGTGEWYNKAKDFHPSSCSGLLAPCHFSQTWIIFCCPRGLSTMFEIVWCLEMKYVQKASTMNQD